MERNTIIIKQTSIYAYVASPLFFFFSTRVFAFHNHVHQLISTNLHASNYSQRSGRVLRFLNMLCSIHLCFLSPIHKLIVPSSQFLVLVHKDLYVLRNCCVVFHYKMELSDQ